MSEANGNESSRPAAENPGLRDFFDVYLGNYERISIESMPQLLDHPVFGPMVRAMPPEQYEAQQKESRQQLEAAVRGDWDTYFARLRVQGEQYAKMGLAFESWYDIIRLYQRSMLPLLVSTFAAEPVRLSAALIEMQDFLDRAMATIAKAYFDSKERSISEQKEIAESRAKQLEASESALRTQSAVLRAVLDGLRDGVIVADERGTYLMTNRAANQITGAPMGPSANVSKLAVFDAAGKQLALEQFPVSRAARGERFDDVEIRIRHESFVGERILSTWGGPLEGAPGLRGGILCFRDVTERKQLEDLERRSRDLEAENLRVQEATRLKSEFLANMSHELRTPLNAIIGFSELLFDGVVEAGSPQYREFLGDILSSGRHLLQLINDILDLSKVEAGKLDFRPESIDVEAIVHEVITILRGQAASNDVRVETHIDPSIGTVYLDPVRFRQILYNYLSNALKFSKRGGQVLVRVSPEGTESFRVEVQDFGVGIADEDIHRLFVPFQQLKSGAAKGQGGTGLGLALTRRLAEAQGGNVGVASEAGKGSVFHAVLPRRSLAVTSLPQRSVRPGAHPSVSRILVVEDDPHDQEFLARTLSDAGYAVETCSTGAQAIARFREATFDAVTLDLVLPDMGGLEVLRAVRASPTGASVPVVIVSVAAEEQAAGGIAVHDVFQKPVDAQTLLASLRRAGLTSGEGKVLVVDDDVSSLKLMEATLMQLGYVATCETDAERALAVAAREPPVAVVLDLLMPSLDGFAFLERFRTLPSARRIPVIIWTVKDVSSEEYARLRITCDAIVRKGGTVTVVEEIRSVLRPRIEEPSGGSS